MGAPRRHSLVRVRCHRRACGGTDSLVERLQARRFDPALRTGLFAAVVLATHPLLDTLTDGGLGCALFWPIDLTRYFAPWRPIQVAPIGLAFLSSYGAIVAMSEIVLFLPLFVFALRTRTSHFRLPRRSFSRGSPPRG